MAPTTPPIRQPVDDVAAAAASFDGITYPKGASALKQLFAFVGEEACVAGLRSYFAKYAWGNTKLDDLMAELGAAAGRDLAGWTLGWLDTAGTDRLVFERHASGGSLLRASGPGGSEPRPHRIDLGVYDRAGEGLERRTLISLETSGDTTPAPEVDGAELVLVNDEDLTFASARPDARSLPVMLSSAGNLPSAVSRAVAVTTAWDMLVNGELPTAEFLTCVCSVLPGEPVQSVVEPYLSLAVEAAENWSPDATRGELLAQVADTCLALADNPDRRQVALRALANTAVTDGQIDALRAQVGDDVDLGWRAFVRLAELGTVDEADVNALSDRDPDPDSWVRALVVDSARPDRAKKEATWDAILVDHKVPMGMLSDVRRAFWRRSQGDLLAPYAERYLESLPTLHLGGMIPAMGISSALYPRAGVGEAFAVKAVVAAEADGVSPIVRKRVIESTDQLRRMLKARSM